MGRAFAILAAALSLVACEPRPVPEIPPPPAAVAASADPGPDFNRDVRPILSNHCFRCHGPDERARKANLRLDTHEGATSLLEGDYRAILPGDPQASELIYRINTDDAEELMPPPEVNLPLSKAQRDVLRRWIAAGAVYEPHWAFAPPKRSVRRSPADPMHAPDVIDELVRERLVKERLARSPEADRPTLLRRVSLALTGLPPSPEEVQAFLSDASPRAYEKQVDRLLASARYGERMAADWLDAARFADTYGYQSDWECRVWPWRDWVIRAFNDNMPYDEFVRQQLAGDLLPGATVEQRLATTFNRLHRQTNEGGSIDAEFLQEYASDRAHTFGTAMLGLTVECARCHDHKFDPITQYEYYSLSAFFGSIDEAGTYPYSTGATPRPSMRLPSPEQAARLAELERSVVAAETTLRAVRALRAEHCDAWLAESPRLLAPPPLMHAPLEGTADGPAGKATIFDGDNGVAFEGVPAFRRCDPRTLAFWIRCPDHKPRATVIHTSNFTIESDQQGYQVMLKDGRLCWEVMHLWPGSAAAIQTTEPLPLDRWVHVCVTYDGSSRASGLSMYLDGERAPTETVRDHLDGPATPRTFQVGYRSRDQGFKGGAVDDLQVFDREISALEAADLAHPGALTRALSDPASHRPALEDYYLRSVDASVHDAIDALRLARAAHQDLLESIPEIMVMEDAKTPRPHYVLNRGRYDEPDIQRPTLPDRAVQAAFAFDAGLPRNRLGLAEWSVDPRNPLTARVQVNRLWAMCFGRGLVLTQENFGLQGDSPSHPEVLDTLAADFVADGWDIKAMLKRIVLTDAFRQSSVQTPDSATKDPQNALLSRGPAHRLSAEMLRDQALAASGLLVEKSGGPSVKPWQPPGLWSDSGATAQGNGEYAPDPGESAHRRSLYTFRKRTVPPPNMLAFDAGGREQCLARRQPTNTPLQALVLLNDPVYFECARALAVRATAQAGPDPARCIERAFLLLVSRPPREPEFGALRSLYDRLLVSFQNDPQNTSAVLASEAHNPHLASLTLVCSTLLASDAAVTSR